MSDIRAAFEQAYNEAEAREEKENAGNTPAPPAPSEPAPPAEAPSADENPPPSETPSPTDKPPTDKAPAPSDAKPTPTEKPSEIDKPPASWTPAAREVWGQVPKEAREYILQRDQKVTDALKASADARRAVNELNQILAPHQQRLMNSGVNSPLKMIGNMLDAEHRLSAGDAHTRAATIANLITGYGVDINVLDEILAKQGRQPAAGAPPLPDIERIIEQRLAPVNQFLQSQQQAQQAQLETTINKFSENAEFLEDVRLDMADILDLAAARGQVVSLEEAYQKACAWHPEVSKIIEARNKQAQLMGTQNDLQRKKQAAASISGLQRGAPPAQAATLRDQIAAAWDGEG